MKIQVKHFGFKVVIFLLIVVSCKSDDHGTSRCQLTPETGPCKALINKYYFDQEEQKCKEFFWGGCDGVVPFDTLEECRECE